jgi:hypothetical protein
MGRFSYSAIVAATLVGALGALSAPAAIIGITNTGVGAPATVDPNYTITSSADPSFPGPAAFVTAAIPGGYFPNDSTSKWIDLSPNANTNIAPGDYDFRTTFSLVGLNPATAVLSGSWSSDNRATMFINGVNTLNALGDSVYNVLTPFSISSGFVAGLNTIDFIVNNDSGPSALRVEISGTASPSGVPEPASLSLLAIGAMLTLTRARRQTA